MSPSLVRVRHVSHQFGAVHALHDISFDVDRGAIVGLFGQRDAGKSTALRAMATLLEPTSGRVEIAGVDVTVEPERARRRIGYLADGGGFYPELTVAEHLMFFAAAYQLDLAAPVERVIALAGLGAVRGERMAALSAGALQGVKLAQTLLHDPELLLLDEPLADLEPPARDEIFALLGRLHAGGKTLVVTSRALANLAGFCTSVLELRGGQLMTDERRAPSSLPPPPAEGARAGNAWHFRVLGTAEAALPTVRALPGVGRAQAAANVLTMEIPGGERVVAEIVRKLVEAGIGITGVRADGGGASAGDGSSS